MKLWIVSPRSFSTPKLRGNTQLNLLSLFKLAKLFQLNLYDKPYFLPGRILTFPILHLAYRLLEDLEIERFVVADPNGSKLEDSWDDNLRLLNNVAILSPLLSGYDQRLHSLRKVYGVSLGDYYVSNGQFLTNILVDMFDRRDLDKKGFLEEGKGFKLLNSCLYSKPSNFLGRKVPSFLLSGNHEKINLIINKLSFKETFLKRERYFYKVVRNELFGKQDG